MKKSKIGILVVGTGNYRHYFSHFHYTFEKRFLPGFEKKYFFFSDIVEQFPSQIELLVVPRQQWPGPTLLRYHYFCAAEKQIKESGVDYLFYCDIDAICNLEVGEEVLPTATNPLIAVEHPGFNGYFPYPKLGTPETRPESVACIKNEEERPYYWAGGFQGGETDRYLHACKELKSMIDVDLSNKIVGIFHDESMWNRYLTSNQNEVKTLSVDCCYPEGDRWKILTTKFGFQPKIMMLEKDHKKIRE